MAPIELSALLDDAEKYLARQDFAQAEKASSAIIAAKGLTPSQAALAHCILGACCYGTGRNEEAGAHYQRAFAAAQKISDAALEARALNGTAIAQRAEPPTAIRTAERALSFAEQARDRAQQARALNTLGNLSIELGDYPVALNYCTRALACAQELGDNTSVAAYLSNIGNVYRNLADYSRALDYFTRSLAIAERAHHSVLIQRNLHLMGEIHSMLAEHERALDFFSRALVLAEALGSQRTAGVLFISMGIVHSNLADYARALDYYSKALAIAEEMDDRYSFAACLDNIGTVYWNLSDYPRALEHFARALAVAEEIGAKTLVANTLGNTGIVYKDKGDYFRALEFLERARSISEETGDRSQAGHWMHGLASTRRKLGQLDAAAEGFLTTLHHRRNVLHTNEGVAETLLELGDVLVEQGKIDEGLARLQEALQLSEQLGEKKFTAEAHRHIADARGMLNDTVGAFEHFKQYHALDKEVFSEESQKRVELFHIRQAVTDKEREAELQRLRADRSEHDLATSTMQLLNQTELLTRFRDDLIEIVRRIPTSGPASAEWEPAIRELKERLRALPSKSVDWTKFEAQFMTVHPEFKAKLLKTYPDITRQELKMCLLGRLGIKTSEMARLLCLSERTIDSHRLSLRKKIGLKKEDSLTQFLAGVR